MPLQKWVLHGRLVASQAAISQSSQMGHFIVQPTRSFVSRKEQRREIDGSLRMVYAASIRSCRPCPLREQCQWNGHATVKPRQVSVLLHPLTVGPTPLLWR